ncbi:MULTISPECIES: tol-pal system protein YbgF [unclassified Janthinobacterium]|uniref:tol-pal system protein YbgF n=1 Tax=unclassified Janthinobacterium TaxID=2610881 RepID=UPI001622305E|nr:MULTISPECIES: tol-pal system protein YbgF [unclassified Janthinobacterium]MBB5369370.1 tol-pal system protein YbgF [Janthinobacterium sp. K2C7]MBB5381094.1 tol-pal system protein YbgF [Janthinobacterium sp. K2Li3]MBB5387753.1 tol-pal system protein YbgF [Janthinobacterium sp. K2E3]
MMTFSKASLAAALMAAFAYLPLHANAALFDDDEARKAILELRAKVDALAQDVNSRIDTKADKTSTLSLINQHDQTMQEIARLRGQIEVLGNDLANTQKRQKDFYTDLDARLRKLEPRQVTIDGQEAAVGVSEQGAYDAALGLFKSGDYKGAATSLDAFVKRYPESAYAANAQYWLGNAYYAQRDCKSAITAQQAVVKNYPDSPKAADAMLNIASCYTELKDKPNATKTLNALISRYPDSNAAQTAKERGGKK